MLKRTLFIIVATVSFIPAAFAEPDVLNDRLGFMIGMGPSVGYEAKDIDEPVGGARFRVGWGFNEKFILFLDNNIFATRKNDLYYTTYNLQVRAEYFIFKNLYVNGGGGLSVGNMTQNSDTGVTDEVNEIKVGFSLGSGLGYEFRLTEHFVLAPEFTFDFDRIKSRNYLIPAGYLNLVWYL
ncbi:MAG: hypothetical protein COV46_07935 [Deltaproteobacteria bacterium CG11_big_fil_rev_8_21_14_0_20_49_13]|nr:MAG: hypothetical protein COV46_07935 [Deltaproteobacteria bacterium CG11_big_fil_rev_8_21_14_0_20_49_13]